MEEKEKIINKELSILEEEIKRLEKYSKNMENKNRTKILKESLVTLRFIAPYLLATLTATGIIYSLKSYLEPYDNNLIKETQIDTLGNTKVTEHYTNNERPLITLTYASKYKLNSNGTYSRRVTIYDVSEVEQELLLNMINSKINIDSKEIDKLLEQIIEVTFKNVINEYTETNSLEEISSEELNNELYLSYSYYDYVNNEYQTKNSNKTSNIYDIINLIIIILNSYAINNRIKYSEYCDKLDLINEQYLSDSPKELKKLIRKKKYVHSILNRIKDNDKNN